MSWLGAVVLRFHCPVLEQTPQKVQLRQKLLELMDHVTLWKLSVGWTEHELRPLSFRQTQTPVLEYISQLHHVARFVKDFNASIQADSHTYSSMDSCALSYYWDCSLDCAAGTLLVHSSSANSHITHHGHRLTDGGWISSETHYYT